MKNIDEVTIVEPPIEEISKELTGKKTFRRACLTNCLVFFVLIASAAIGLKMYVGPGPQTFKNVPNNFPAEIPVYDKDAAERIIYIPKKYKSRGLEIAALFPKIILSPALIGNQNNSGYGGDKSFWELLTTPISNHNDTFQIEWTNIDTGPNFIISYYKKELRKQNFAIDVESEGKEIKQFSFSKNNGLNGSLYARGNENKRPATEYMILTVNLAN